MEKTGFRYPKQIKDALEKAYGRNPDARGHQCKDIASSLGLKTHEVRRWFQTKRYRVKHANKVKPPVKVQEGNDKLNNQSKPLANTSDASEKKEEVNIKEGASKVVVIPVRWVIIAGV